MHTLIFAVFNLLCLGIQIKLIRAGITSEVQQYLYIVEYHLRPWKQWVLLSPWCRTWASLPGSGGVRDAFLGSPASAPLPRPPASVLILSGRLLHGLHPRLD